MEKCAKCARLTHLVNLAYDALLLAHVSRRDAAEDAEARAQDEMTARTRWQSAIDAKANHERKHHSQNMPPPRTTTPPEEISN